MTDAIIKEFPVYSPITELQNLEILVMLFESMEFQGRQNVLAYLNEKYRDKP